MPKFKIPLLKDHWKPIAHYTVGWFIIMLLESTIPIILGIMINMIVYYRNYDVIIELAMAFIIIFLLISVQYYFIYTQHSYLLSNYVWNIKYELFKRIINADRKERNSVDIGDCISTIQKDSVECVNYIIRNHVRITLFLVFVCIYIFYIFNINIILGIITLFLAVSTLIISHFVGKKVKLYSQNARQEEKKYTDWLYDQLQGGMDIKLLNAQTFILSQDQSRQSQMMCQINLVNILKKKYQKMMAVLNFLSSNVFLYCIAVLVTKNKIFIGDLIVILAFYSKIISNMNAILSNKLEAMQRTANINQLNYFLLLKQDDIRMRTGVLKVKKGELRIEDICFNYEQDQKTLSYRSINVPSGKSCVIVGASGSGKTTLFKLILQQYPLLKGNIFIDNQNLSKCSVSSIFNNIGYVAQKPFIINGTVKDNVCFGNTVFNDRMICDVCEQVGLLKNIALLPKGLNTIIGQDGVQLSIGQQQLICIARVLLKKTNLIFLDEPTNSLDTETGKQVLDVIFKVFKGKTILIISHDENIIKLCDIKYYVNK
ncbi:hypothetical protein C0033_10530 [Clostridium sp. chh4-2]|uniref:ATP-binding cassette domain-containing protein n=1 Tax=Clostridium sp. chh4-2 TaxID=2067550 RepID=UPI000CCE348D|nr:ABC transporter ATP-binding protein [Clostridium sp. chh4-2]PNV62081.1 hypothetical protein C0033_10530 [Clostridium sp. chh4-2]